MPCQKKLNKRVMWACNMKDPAALHAALDAGGSPDSIGKFNCCRSTALGKACEYGRVESVRILLDRGANVNLKKPNRDHWINPSMIAALRGHYQCLELLLAAGEIPTTLLVYHMMYGVHEAESVTYLDHDGREPYELPKREAAVIAMTRRMVNEYGLIIVDEPVGPSDDFDDLNDVTLLMQAAATGSVGMINMLLSHCEWDLNRDCANFTTALGHTFSRMIYPMMPKHLEAARLLLYQGADPNAGDISPLEDVVGRIDWMVSEEAYPWKSSDATSDNDDSRRFCPTPQLVCNTYDYGPCDAGIGFDRTHLSTQTCVGIVETLIACGADTSSLMTFINGTRMPVMKAFSQIMRGATKFTGRQTVALARWPLENVEWCPPRHKDFIGFATNFGLFRKFVSSVSTLCRTCLDSFVVERTAQVLADVPESKLTLIPYPWKPRRPSPVRVSEVDFTLRSKVDGTSQKVPASSVHRFGLITDFLECNMGSTFEVDAPGPAICNVISLPSAADTLQLSDEESAWFKAVQDEGTLTDTLRAADYLAESGVLELVARRLARAFLDDEAIEELLGCDLATVEQAEALYPWLQG